MTLINSNYVSMSRTDTCFSISLNLNAYYIYFNSGMCAKNSGDIWVGSVGSGKIIILNIKQKRIKRVRK